MTAPDEFPKRFPLAVEPGNRSLSTTQDARLVNAYLETQPNGDGVYVIKRPGLAKSVTYSKGTTGAGLGIFYWFQDVYQIVGTSFIKNSTTLGTVDATAGAVYSWTSFQGAVPTLFFGNGVRSYYYNLNSGFVTALPNTFVRGLVTLDGTAYYFDSTATIRGSGINDVTTWSVLNSIVAQIEPDRPIALAKHLTYVIAFKQWTTEVFTDNGNPSGSPLAAQPGSVIQIGCYSDKSITDIDGDLFWVSATKSGSVDVYQMSGLTATKISSPNIQKILESSTFAETTTYAWYYKGGGHTFYVISLGDIDITLAYDIVEKHWAQWTDSSGHYLPIAASSFHATQTLLQHQTNGNVYTMSLAQTTDDGSLFQVDIYTPLFDGRVDRRKTINLLRINADQTDGSLLKIRSNDFNFNPTKWTNFRQVNLGLQRPFLANCGTFYTRSYHFSHKCNTPLRIYSIDIDVDLGTL